jgi:hypothetical protein
MANTYVDYTAVAAQTDYNFSFEYLRDEHVKVKVDGNDVTSFTIVTSPTPTKVRFDAAPSAGSSIKIYRDSRGDYSPLVDFVDGSILTENELDEGYKHNLFLAQEASEGQGGEQLTKKGLEHYDAEGNKIINLFAPSADTDAANKAYVDDTIDTAIALGGSPAIVSLGGYGVTALGSTTQRSLANRFGEVVNIKDFGAVGNGSTDDSAAFTAAFAALNEYDTLYIPAGHYIIDSDTLSDNYFQIPNNYVTIQGSGSASSLIEVTGSTAKGIIYANNKHNITISGIAFKSNNVANTVGGGFNAGNSTAIWFNYTDTTTSTNDGNILVDNCSFEDFKGVYWVSTHNNRTSTTHPVRNIKYNNLNCKGGGDPVPNSGGYVARQIGVHSIHGGLIEGLIVTNCICDANAVKAGIGSQGKIHNISIDSCHVKNAGQADGDESRGSGYLTSRYAILLYNDCEDVSVTNCIISDPYTAGIYALDTLRLTVNNNVFTGQVATIDTSLPVGALTAHQSDLTATGNRFYDNALNISSTIGAGQKNVLISGNTFDGGNSKISQPLSASSLPISGGGFIGNHFRDSRITLRSASPSHSVLWSNLNITNNTFEAPATGTQTSFIAGAGGTGFEKLLIKNNTFEVESSTSIDNFIQGAGGAVLGEKPQIIGNTFQGTPNSRVLNIDQAGVAIIDNVFRDVNPTSGNYIFTITRPQDGAKSFGNRFENCDETKILESTAFADLGLERPSWVGEINDQVQSFQENLVGHWTWSEDGQDWGFGDEILYFDSSGSAVTAEVEFDGLGVGSLFEVGIVAKSYAGGASFNQNFTGYLSLRLDTSAGASRHVIELDEQLKTTPLSTAAWASFDVNIDVKTSTLAYSGVYAKTKNINATNDGTVTHVKFQIGTAASGFTVNVYSISLKRFKAV